MKLIVNPNECSHQSDVILVKKGTTFVPACIHPRANVSISGSPCTNSRDFPTNCPLQDGVVKSKDFATEMREKYFYKPRRNRKNCTHYRKPFRCMTSNRRDVYCIGVNCGYYKSK